MKKLICIGLLTSLAGCASSTPEKTYTKTGAEADSAQTSIEAKQAAAQIGSAQVVELKYKKGAAELEASEVTKIDKEIDKAGKAGSLNEATLVCWSDAEMPAGKKDLPDSDVKLADARCDLLKNVLEAKLPKVKTSEVNMAKQPGKIQKFLKTKDVRVQEALKIAGAPSTESKAAGKQKSLSHEDPKASTAILIFSK